MIGISAGNHAQALAWGRTEGIDCVVVMWQGASEADRRHPRLRCGSRPTRGRSAHGVPPARRADGRDGQDVGAPVRRPRRDRGPGDAPRRAGAARDAPEVEPILVPVGGSGLAAGIAAATRAAASWRSSCTPRPCTPPSRPTTRFRSPPTRSPTGSPLRSRARLRSLDQANEVESVLVSEEEIEDAFRFCARAKLACDGGSGRRRRAPGRESRGRRDRRRCLGWKRRCPNRLCYPGPAMKTGIHPEYVSTHVRCSCGNEFETRSTRGGIHVDVCSACHPFYTGKQKLMDSGGRVERFQRRLEEGGRRAPRLATRVEQQHRRAGCPRGRDDAQPVEVGRRGPQARRRDRPGGEGHHLADGEGASSGCR